MLSDVLIAVGVLGQPQRSSLPLSPAGSPDMCQGCLELPHAMWVMPQRGRIWKGEVQRENK